MANTYTKMCAVGPCLEWAAEDTKYCEEHLKERGMANELRICKTEGCNGKAGRVTGLCQKCRYKVQIREYREFEERQEARRQARQIEQEVQDVDFSL